MFRNSTWNENHLQEGSFTGNFICLESEGLSFRNEVTHRSTPHGGRLNFLKGLSLEDEVFLTSGRRCTMGFPY